MNPFLKLEIQNHTMVCQNFISSCELATKKDDDKTNEQEKKALKRIQKATENYIKELEKAIK